jgi:hypothetical protein
MELRVVLLTPFEHGLMCQSSQKMALVPHRSPRVIIPADPAPQLTAPRADSGKPRWRVRRTAQEREWAAARAVADAKRVEAERKANR